MWRRRGLAAVTRLTDLQRAAERLEDAIGFFQTEDRAGEPQNIGESIAVDTLIPAARELIGLVKSMRWVQT